VAVGVDALGLRSRVTGSTRMWPCRVSRKRCPGHPPALTGPTYRDGLQRARAIRQSTPVAVVRGRSILDWSIAQGGSSRTPSIPRGSVVLPRSKASFARIPPREIYDRTRHPACCDQHALRARGHGRRVRPALAAADQLLLIPTSFTTGLCGARTSREFTNATTTQVLRTLPHVSTDLLDPGTSRQLSFP